MKSLAPLLAAALLAAVPSVASAWGNSGHRIIGEAAVRALPAEVPAFVRTPKAALDVGELSREPDRSKGAGKAYDSDHSPAHFVDLGDDGRVFGGPSLIALPPTLADYDAALRAVGQDAWKAGYLPYAIVESYQQLVQDFAYWRVLNYAETAPRWRAHRGWFHADRLRREALILRDLGQLSHFVADGSQPLHVTIHFNGWGDFANPEGFTLDKGFHAAFEGDLVNASVSPSAVAARMTPLNVCGCAIEGRVGAYLQATGDQVVPLYRLEKAGAVTAGDTRGAAFATERMAVGAAELRDLVVEAWRASAGQKVGWKPVPASEILAGRVDPYPPLYATSD